ncbi:MAG: exodeoxyribonuclease VII large subunit [Clostridia bacterium]|nr:exodeoxyribonuclease VII large subunit [Clostridia bacterium]
MEQIIATVSQLNGFIKKTFEANPVFSDIWIKGEISNFKKHYSGHIYLTLKDEGGVLKAVMFKSSAYSLSFTPSDGMKVIARGRVSVYEASGAYQLYISEMLPDGVGELYIAYEKLKKKLEAEGLFDEEHKKPIPKYPSSVGVVTASTGAAVRDIINVMTRRYPYAEIIVYPAQVQGAGAAESIVKGIEYFNREKICDTIIVGRGGGSIEDLWAFNEEMVAYAIYNSEIPIVSAVGHEVDFTISDFVADLRAPTPSAAAELAVPSQTELMRKIEDLEYAIKTLLVSNLKNKKLKLNSVKLISPQDIIENYFLRLDASTKEIINGMEKVISINKEKYVGILSRLDALSPLKVLKRGFSVAVDENENVIKSVAELDEKKNFVLRLFDGERNCRVINKKEIGE